MISSRRGIPAAQVARDFAESLASFSDSVLALVGELGPNDAVASDSDRYRETAAALWAAIVISMEASALRVDERAALTPLVFATLQSHWKKRYGPKDCAAASIPEAAQKYLEVTKENQVTAAAQLVATLFDRLQVSDSGRRKLFRRLSALFAHRILGDVHRLNEVRIHFGIQLTLMAGLLSVLPMLHAEALLRLLRLA